MNDFINEIVAWAIAVITVLSIVGCAVFMWVQGRKPVVASMDRQTNTTGHVWDDDLQELNNPMPRWWLWLFYLTIVFGLAYVVLFPGLATTQGQLGWSSDGQYQAETKALAEQRHQVYQAVAGLSAEQLASHPKAQAMGQSLFLNHCAQCHGSDARGSKGFPNLTDQDWLYGGDVQSIQTSIAQGRHGVMPPMMEAVGGEARAREVAQYVLSLSGRDSDAAKAQLGRRVFQSACVACHGQDGGGNHALGAPNLRDRIWLYGGTEQAILETIRLGRGGQMPAHAERFDADQLRILSAYVWSLSRSVADAVGQDSSR